MEKNRYQYVIQVACAITLFGYAWMHFFYRGFNLWKIYDSSFVKFICRIFDIQITSIFYRGAPTKAYLLFLTITGIILTMTGISALLQHKYSSQLKKVTLPLYILSGIIILLHAFSTLIASKLHINVFFEYTIRFGLPFLAAYILFQPNKKKLVRYYLPIAIALTFCAHGLYAIRVFPIPQNFLLMTTNILKTPRSVTFTILYIAGAIDILFIIGIFIKPFQKVFIYYAIIWGFLTALARLVAYYNPLIVEAYLLFWIPQFLIRTGHFLVPLAMLYILKDSEKTKFSI